MTQNELQNLISSYNTYTSAVVFSPHANARDSRLIVTLRCQTLVEGAIAEKEL